MRLLKIVVAMLCVAFVAGCTFQSDVLLPDFAAAGDSIAGFPADTSFKLESFDRQTGAYHDLGTMTSATEGGHVRYTFVFNGESKKVRVQARKLADNNYVLRYVELDEGNVPNPNETALLFLSVEGGTYYVLTSLADKPLFEKIYGSAPRPDVVNDAITFATDEQAATLSAYFSAHRDEFRIDQDYVRMRLKG